MMKPVAAKVRLNYVIDSDRGLCDLVVAFFVQYNCTTQSAATYDKDAKYHHNTHFYSSVSIEWGPVQVREFLYFDFRDKQSSFVKYYRFYFQHFFIKDNI